jgi:hypothetical protein
MRSTPFYPEPIDVYTTGDSPTQVYFKKKMQRVREITNLWRVDDGWWSNPTSRMYYALELVSGSRITV